MGSEDDGRAGGGTRRSYCCQWIFWGIMLLTVIILCGVMVLMWRNWKELEVLQDRIATQHDHLSQWTGLTGGKTFLQSSWAGRIEKLD